MIWLNSPSNPTGRVLPVEHLRKVVDWARERGTVVASDECYLDLGWEEQLQSETAARRAGAPARAPASPRPGCRSARSL